VKLKLSRVLQSQGVGTRRICIERVKAGLVSVNGAVCVSPDALFDTTDLQFTIEGETWLYRDKVYLALHKPAGYECSHQPLHHPSVFSLLPAPLLQRGVQCVGRLDQDTTGLLLFTDDGAFIHRATSPAKHMNKVYEVRCKHTVDETQLAALLHGVQLRDASEPVAALACTQVAPQRLQMTIAEGKYHQVKRMVSAAGNRVEALHRVAIGGYSLPADLLPGAWRWLSAADMVQLEGVPRGSA
jgi:16S rRNA pseudouridine516 synthase